MIIVIIYRKLKCFSNVCTLSWVACRWEMISFQSRLDVYLAQSQAGTSVQNMLHWAQVHVLSPRLTYSSVCKILEGWSQRAPCRACRYLPIIVLLLEPAIVPPLDDLCCHLFLSSVPGLGVCSPHILNEFSSLGSSLSLFGEGLFFLFWEIISFGPTLCKMMQPVPEIPVHLPVSPRGCSACKENALFWTEEILQRD